MRAFFTAEQVQNSKRIWEPQLREYASLMNTSLRGVRRLPIYDQAVKRATAWLKYTVNNRVDLRQPDILLIVGDEHLEAATSQVPLPPRSLFLYSQAWDHWSNHVFSGEAPWWESISWSINSSDRIIHHSYLGNQNLELTPNQTFLCSEYVAYRGTDTLLKLVDGELTTHKPYGEWVVCV